MSFTDEFDKVIHDFKEVFEEPPKSSMRRDTLRSMKELMLDIIRFDQK